MTATTAAVAATTAPKKGHLFFEKLWRMNGVTSVALLAAGGILAGFGPGVGASAQDVTAYYAANSVRILIATPLLGLGVLGLMWFAASIRTILAERGLDGWGAAATAASSAVASIGFLLVAAQAALALTIAGSGNASFVTGLNDLSWAGFVLWSLPRAMFVMAPSFGFWRAGIISDKEFMAAVALVIAGVLGVTTWIDGTIWAPDGLFSLVVLPVLSLAWIVAISRVLERVPSTKNGF